MAPNQTEIFFSYSKADVKLRDELAKHLRDLERKRVINVWDESEISAGKERTEEIEKHLNSARIILLLVSPDFIDSDELWQRDVKIAMKRRNAKEALVIPVLLRTCEWKATQLGGLQALPINEEFITNWQNKDEAFKEVAKGIREAIEGKLDYISIPQTSKRRFKIPQRSLRNTFFTSVPITLLVIVMRVMGIFEASELLFFNRMMREQQPDNQDSNLLLVQITQDDINHYKSDPKKYGIPQPTASLSDKIIFQLLNSLIEKDPRVIGVDIYRDFAANDPDLIKLFKDKEKTKSLIFVCKFPYTTSLSLSLQEKDKGYDPPPDIPIEQVGLSDLLDDRDGGVIRRQLLTMGTKSTPGTKDSKCRNKEKGEMESFSFKVAQKYLATDKKLKPYSKLKREDFFKSGNIVLQPLNIDTQGGYNLKNFDGYQILLNYRSVEQDKIVSPHHLAQTTNVQAVLDSKIEDNLVKDKIVLIGTPVESFDPAYPTPFSSRGTEPKMRGLYLQAQMVSQLVSAVSDQKPRLLKVISIGYEVLFILIGSILGSIVPQLCKKSKYFILGGSYLFCILSFYFMCYFLFSLPTKLWIPFFSPICAFTLSVGVVIILVDLQSPKNN